MSFIITQESKDNVVFTKESFVVTYWKHKQNSQTCCFCKGSSNKMFEYKGVLFCQKCFKEFMTIGREAKQLSSPVSKLYKGIKTRPGFFKQDKIVIDDSIECYKSLIAQLTSEDIVLDLGSNIGDFSILASQKAQKVVAYDADKNLVDWNSSNQNAPNITYNWAAIVGSKETEVEFNLSQWSSSNTLLKKNCQYKTIKVPAVNFSQLLEEIKPTVLKVDLEGIEWEFDWTLPEYVNLLAIEIHYNDTNTRVNDTLTTNLLKQFSQVLLDKNFKWETRKSEENSVVGRNLVLARRNFKLSEVSQT